MWSTPFHMGSAVRNQLIEVLSQSHQLPVHLQVVPTMREASGLAMSSRNRRLTPAQREASVAMYHALQHMAAHARTTPIAALEAAAAHTLLQRRSGRSQPDSRTAGMDRIPAHGYFSC